jgi:hypothetical protein
MNVISRLGKITFAVMAAILSGVAAEATPITVPNASFESPTSPSETATNPTLIAGWVFNVKGGSEYGTEAISNHFSSRGASLGSNAAFINNDALDVTDTITSASSLGTIAPLTTYTLTLAIGNHNGTALYDNPGNVSFSLLANGVAFATQTVTNGTVPEGTFEDFTLTYTTPSSSSIIGDNLTIQIATLPQTGSAFQPAFDNVTLDALTLDPPAVPEPGTVSMVALGLIALAAVMLLRRVLALRATVFSGLLFAAILTSATGNPIAVPNASFENPTTPTGGDGAPIAGWVFNSPSGNLFGTSLIANSFKSEGAASGNNYAWMFNDVLGKTDTITSASSLGTIAANTKYTLTVAIGNVAGSDSVSNHSPGNVSFSLLANGVAFATDTVPNGTVPDGTFEDFSLTFQTPSASSIIGDSLEIQLASLPTSSLGYGPTFDNITLDATTIAAAPEPPTWALLISGALTLFLLARRKRDAWCNQVPRNSAIALVLALLICGAGLSRAEAIKTFPLDDQTVYRLKVGTDKVTTLVFPQPITALEGSGLTSDAKTPARMLLSYHAGDRFLSLRSLADSASATLNVIINRKVYVLELTTDKDPVQSVTFYPADEPPAQSAGQPNIGPSRLLGLLDKAKAYPLLAEQYPEMVSQIDKAEPFSQTLYEGFHVILSQVFRFDAEDALIFQIELVNETDKPISYVPQSLAVRVGPAVYWSALTDASGIITAGVKDPKTGKIIPSHSNGYFVICGAPHGGRNHLSVHNNFNVLVFRQEKS